ncbi:MAG: terminase large subunit domain-containing protein [Desulfovibrio sp.]
MKQYADEVVQAARGMFLRKYKVPEISEELNIPKRTLYYWLNQGQWNDLLAVETPEEALKRRLALLIERDGKSKAELQEMEKLVGWWERMKKLSQIQSKQAALLESSGSDGSARSGGGKRGQKRGKKKNDVSKLTVQDFKDKFHKYYYQYQKELQAAKEYRNRWLLKSRQIGATWYFAQEAFEDACLTGDNQIFLSATRAQSEVFRTYIVNLAAEKFDIELKGNPLKLHTPNGVAELHFLSNNSKSAQSYHGHVYIDECFWINKFPELFKVATGMAAHKKWRRTFFSTPSAINHAAYPYWSGDNYLKRFKKKNVQFPGFKELQSGVLCPDENWRKIITLEDAMEGGCDLFDIKQLKLEYSEEEFKNLFMCEFVDPTDAVFTLDALMACMVDSREEWKDVDFDSAEPYGNRPVWGGYDPSRKKDDASFVVVAPDLDGTGEHRVLERLTWRNKSWGWQAEQIKKLTQKYNFVHIGIDMTGPGMGIYEKVKAFFPAAEGYHYTNELKCRLVLKAQDLIEAGRVKWDASEDIGYSFMMIRQGVTPNGYVTYVANRTADTGHADVAFALMHALYKEPIRGRKKCTVG